MGKFLVGLWFGFLGTVLASMWIVEKPMRDACDVLGGDYRMVSYNDEAVVCMDGRQRAIVLR